MRGIVLLLLVAVVTSACGADGELGSPSHPMNGVAEFLSRHRLPALPSLDRSIARYARAQVLQRCRGLGIDENTVSASLAQLPDLERSIDTAVSEPSGIVEFDGVRFSELADLIAGRSGRSLVRVKARGLTADRVLAISRPGTHIDFAGATVEASDVTSAGYCLTVEGTTDVSIARLVLRGVSGGIYVTDSERVVVRESHFADTGGNPIRIAGPVRHFRISGNRFERSGHAAILVDFDTTDGIIEDNRIEGGRGWQNFQAGILLSDKGWHRLKDPVRGVPRIDQRLKPPTRIIVRRNTVANGMSSGIYCDGAVMNFILDNRIVGNSKEGLCFDGGSTGNVLYGNTIRDNGKRFGMTDQALEGDFVLRWGRLDDGTAAAKLPGVSIDNAAYNVVVANLVQGNSGGGVKMVRAGLLNTIAFNSVIDNNEGANDTFHFFGIELGGAEADAPVPDLDFMPSCANRIVGNVIVGDHHSGILAVRGSVRNVMRENMILGAKQWSVDSSVKQENAVVNIFSTAKPLNVRLSTDSSIVMPGEQKRSGKQTRCEGRPSPASGKMCPWDRVLAAPCGGL